MLTDKDIIKALECCLCLQEYGGDCDEGCPLLETDCCHYMLLEQSLVFINRQQAENERLKDILYDADGINLVNYWYQQYEITENCCRNFQEENKNLQAEIKRLEAENKALIEYGIHERYPHIVLCNNGAIFTKSLEEYDKLIADISTNAIKEFAERLKNIYIKDKRYDRPNAHTLIDWLFANIDNLVKERVGENNV